MTAEGDIYRSRRLAHGYAFHRPPVHARVLALVAEDLRLTGPVGRALDVGCGAGLSTAALAPLARVSVGLEPAADMLTYRGEVAPHGRFVVARAEAPPFATGAFDLITAAGSLNYVDVSRFLPEASRLLASGGTLVVYDFSTGRRVAGDTALEAWFAVFEQRYPYPAGYGFDLARLDNERAGLRVVHRREFVVSLPMTGSAYLDYVLTESNIEQAIAAGAPVEDVRAWCRDGIAPVFEDGPREVQFEGYVVYVRTVPG